MTAIAANTPLTHTACACAHCGLPVPSHEMRAADPTPFCCSGCRAVWHSLHDAGLAAYYELAAREERREGENFPARVSGRGFEHLDREAFAQAHVSQRGGVACARLRIDGLHCGACIWLLESLPRIVPGLVASRVNLAESAVELAWNPAATQLSSVARSFDSLGYQLSAVGAIRDEAAQRQRTRRQLIALGAAGGLTVNAMGLAFGLYGGLIDSMPAAMRIFLQWWSVSIAMLALVWPGRVFFLNAIAAIRAGVPHMDIPVAFGLASAVAAGIVSTILGAGAIYCEGATMLVFLLLVGRYLQTSQQRRALQRVESLFNIIPATAFRVETALDCADAQTHTREVFVDELQVNDLIEVPAHELLGADGVLVSEACHLDLSHLTGESRPVLRHCGDVVEAGSRALERSARVRVTRVGSDTRAASILELVREASKRRAPICLLADRIAGWFLMTVLITAACTIVFWWPRIGGFEATARTVALLVVTCPCALGLATPLAMLAGIGSAARHGVLIKGGDTLERLARVGTVILDKTGTITRGQPEVVEIEGDASAIALAAQLERSSVHPIARALINAAGSSAQLESLDNIIEHAGSGVEGVGLRGRVAVGSLQLMHRAQMTVPDHFTQRANAFAAAGISPVFVARGDCVIALIGVGDAIRTDARATIAALRSRGWAIHLASGDHAAVALDIGRKVGLEAHEIHGELTPEAKLLLVSDPSLARPTVMVGDGINDLAALAAADCGVAVRGGAQSATTTADACLSGEGLAPLARLLGTARCTMQTIHLNLALSVAYNALGAVLAFFGFVNPIVASILMPLSGLTVLVTSLRGARAPSDAQLGLSSIRASLATSATSETH
ncbi:MAG: heavy metal translocating P-type ATPase [Planctomycetota bacterium]|nr:MAG: heavy metal translocating P-type ATPase [Planctomycetota bacterium]